MAIPSVAKSFFSRPATWHLACDVLIAIGAAAVGLTTAYRFWTDERALSVIIGSGTVIVLLFTAIRAGLQYRERARKESLHDLEGCLHPLHTILVGKEQDAGLRITIHVPVANGTKLQQVLDYVGHERGGRTAGRTFPVQSGVTGKAFREHDPFVASRENDDYEKYIEELVKRWNYTEADARKLNPATMAWMAIPLIDECTNTVEGVLYLDALKRDFFNPDRQVLGVLAAIGIAFFVGKRYSG